MQDLESLIKLFYGQFGTMQAKSLHYFMNREKHHVDYSLFLLGVFAALRRPCFWKRLFQLGRLHASGSNPMCVSCSLQLAPACQY